MDIVSRLLEDGGGRKEFVNILLLLQPKDLKACRLVCSSWNNFIIEEVWGIKAGRAKLRQKLLRCWENTDGDGIKRVEEARLEVYNIFSNDDHIFSADKKGLISVYTLCGAWVRDLNTEKLIRSPMLAGGKDILAAVSGSSKVTFNSIIVWATHGDMKKLHELSLGFRDFEISFVREICVAEGASNIRSRVAFWTRNKNSTDSLYVLEMDDKMMWDDKTLACFKIPDGNCMLAAKGKGIAVAWSNTGVDEEQEDEEEDEEEEENEAVEEEEEAEEAEEEEDEEADREELEERFRKLETRVALWWGDKKLPDVIIPQVNLNALAVDSVEDTPFVIVHVCDFLRDAAEVRVYKFDPSNLAANLMRSIRTSSCPTGKPELGGEPHPLDWHVTCQFFSNSLIFGFKLLNESLMPWKSTLTIVDKKKLLTFERGLAEENKGLREVTLPDYSSVVNVNLTHIILALDYDDGEVVDEQKLYVKDVWMN